MSDTDGKLKISKKFLGDGVKKEGLIAIGVRKGGCCVCVKIHKNHWVRCLCSHLNHVNLFLT